MKKRFTLLLNQNSYDLAVFIAAMDAGRPSSRFKQYKVYNLIKMNLNERKISYLKYFPSLYS